MSSKSSAAPAVKQHGNNDNYFLDNYVMMKTPNWEIITSTSKDQAIEDLNNNYSFNFKLVAKAIESLLSQTKMYAKRNILPQSEYKNVYKGLVTLQKSLALESEESFENINPYEWLSKKMQTLCDEQSFSWFSYIFENPSQLSGDLSLMLKDYYEATNSSLQKLQATLIEKAEENVKTIFPAMHNNQPTQPTSFGLHLMSHVETFGRDRERILSSYRIHNTSPYCSGQSSGNLLNINRETVAKNLGFLNVNNNSINSVSAFDNVLDYTASFAVVATNASRLAAELSNWSAANNKFVEFSNNVSECHDVLPYGRQSKALEIVRAECLKVQNNFLNVSALLNSRPLNYSDSYLNFVQHVTDTFNSLQKVIDSLQVLVKDFIVNKKVMKEAATKDFSTAQDLQDWLIVNAKLSPKDAGECTKQIISYAIQKNKKLSLLELDELKQFNNGINNDIYSVLIPSRALISRRSGNGSNPVQIRKAIRAARRDYL